MFDFHFYLKLSCILFSIILFSCEEREVLPFEDIYTQEIKELFDEIDPCESVTRNNFDIKTVPIDEGRRLQRRPYQVLNINTGNDTYLLFGKHNTFDELDEQNMLVIDSEDGLFRNIYHFSCPLNQVNEFNFTNGSCFLQIFQYDKQGEKLIPRVVEIIYINKTSLAQDRAFDIAVNILEIDIETLQPDKSIFFISEDESGNLDQVSPYNESGLELLKEQVFLLCGERRLFEACSSRQISINFAYSAIDQIPFTDFLAEHINTLSPSFFRLTEIPEFYKPLIEPWLKAVRQEKVFDQVACFFNTFEMQADVDFQFDFDN